MNWDVRLIKPKHNCILFNIGNCQMILVLTLDFTLSLDQSQVKFGLDFGLKTKSSQDFSLRLKS